MIEVSVYLFGTPSWELKIEGLNHINADILRIKGDELKERLENIADVTEILQNNGWCLWGAHGSIYGLDFFKEDLNNVEQAKKEVASLGIDLKIVDVHELMY